MKRLFLLLMLAIVVLSCENFQDYINGITPDSDIIEDEESGGDITLPTTPVPNNEIWYTTTDGKPLAFDEDVKLKFEIVSNTYVNGKGVIQFDGDVTVIVEEAFANSTTLSSISIPASIQTIDRCAFSGCNNLKIVNVSDLAAWCNIVFITNDCLSANPLSCARNLYLNGELITDLVIPDGVEQIKPSAFCFCNVQSVVIPESVAQIGEHAFYFCNNLKNIIISNGVAIIDDYAFAWCSSLVDISIPDSVTTMGKYLFKDCGSLTNIHIGDGVTIIDDFTFWGCDSLICINIPNSVTSIGAFAFKECTALESITLGEGLTVIGEEAFDTCCNLSSVYVPNLSVWCNMVFVSCMSNPIFGEAELFVNGELLTDLVIPDDVTTIGHEIFSMCNSITSVVILDSVTTIEEFAFFGCRNLLTVTIGDGVTSIGAGAFEGCESLTDLTIGSSVATIQDWAFFGCCNLVSVYCKPIIPPTVNSMMFNYNVENRIIYVPTESVDAYKSADGWSEYADAIEGYNF